MKKNVLLILVCTMAWTFMPGTTYGQGFLKKLKQKVEKTVVGEDEMYHSKAAMKKFAERIENH